MYLGEGVGFGQCGSFQLCAAKRRVMPSSVVGVAELHAARRSTPSGLTRNANLFLWLRTTRQRVTVLILVSSTGPALDAMSRARPLREADAHLGVRGEEVPRGHPKGAQILPKGLGREVFYLLV